MTGFGEEGRDTGHGPRGTSIMEGCATVFTVTKVGIGLAFNEELYNVSMAVHRSHVKRTLSKVILDVCEFLLLDGRREGRKESPHNRNVALSDAFKDSLLDLHVLRGPLDLLCVELLELPWNH